MPAINPLVLGLYSIGLGALVSGIYFLDIYPELEQASKEIKNGFGLMMALSGIGALIPAVQLIYFTPLREPFNGFFGVPLFAFGLVSVAGGYSVYRDFDLRPLSWFAAGTGVIASNNVYATLIHFTTRYDSYLPIFILSVFSGFSLLPATHVKSKWARRLAGMLLVLLAATAMDIGVRAEIGHIIGPSSSFFCDQCMPVY